MTHGIPGPIQRRQLIHQLGPRQGGRKRHRQNTDMTLEMNTLKQGNMNAFVTKFKPDEWRVSHCHHSSLHLNVSEYLMSQWRSEVESQGCAFIVNVMFRDPLSHSMSLYKHIKRFNSSREEWNDHLNTTSEIGYWQTQLDYFLYNFLERNPVSADIIYYLFRWFIYLHGWLWYNMILEG